MCLFSLKRENGDMEDDVTKNKRINNNGTTSGRSKSRIKRLPTILIRRPNTLKHPMQKLIAVSLLGSHGSHINTAEAPYFSHFAPYFERVYLEACGGPGKPLTQERFVEFLRYTQGEEVASPPPKDKYTCPEFLGEWSVRYGLGAMRDLRPDEKDLSKPISSYFISSSHNTYLAGHQLFSESSSKLYRKVLERHCRCIEIDVWDGDTSAKTPTPSPSRSPTPSHNRDGSSSSIPTCETVKQLFKGGRSPGPQNRHASAREPVAAPPISAAESSNSLDPEELTGHLGRSRAKSNSSLNRSEPVVMHAYKGFTLTQPVGFREVCRAVKESAFAHNNHLPIIVSLEVHASLAQQEVMVEIMKEEWGSHLLDKSLEECNPLERQPSPAELLDKILIKVKRRRPKPTASSSKLSTLAPAALDDDASVSDEDRCEEAGEKRKIVPICDSLAALAIYTHSEHFRGFLGPSANTHSHIFSIVEGRIRELYEKSPAELLAHNRRHFMRAYPDPWLRVKSRNPDPSLFWRKGVQMVALNWQDDKYDQMVLHDAMFTEDTQGWVLKPPGYRGTDDDIQEPEYQTMTLRITIYGGLHVPLPEARLQKGASNTSQAVIMGVDDGDKGFKPSVQVDLAVSHEKPSGKLVKKTSPKETTKPNWGPNGFTLEFVEIPMVVEELSFVRFKIQDESPYFREQVAAWACIRLDRLRQGYRFIDLMDCKGNPSDGKLFVKIDKKVVRPTTGNLLTARTMKWWKNMKASK